MRRIKDFLQTVAAIAFALVVGYLIYGYISFLMERGCYPGTTCISIMR